MAPHADGTKPSFFWVVLAALGSSLANAVTALGSGSFLPMHRPEQDPPTQREEYRP